ncbi:MAG: hypothetical protein ACTHZ7_06195, partial [Sphingobacterium sp.]
PLIEENQRGISIVFLKDIYREDYLRKLNINERQIKAVLYIKEHGKITNASYQEINNIGKTLATEELGDLVNRELIQQSGTKGRGSRYELVRKI